MKKNIKNHSFDSTILREYDIRGILDKTLFSLDAYAIGLSFGTIVKKKNGSSIAVAYDGRHSSPLLHEALIDGLTDTGIDVITVGLGPTPMLYFAVHYLDLDGGIMITGSHNPPNYNGFKFMIGKKGFFGNDIQNLGKISKEGDYLKGNGKLYQNKIQEKYINRLLRDITIPNSMSVAWDPGNGATGEVVSNLTKILPGKHYLINNEIDGSFPNHHPDPTIEKNLKQLKDVVLENNCDLGIAFDGDGDRIGVLDSKGRTIFGDQLLAILARDVLHQFPGATIIGDVKCSNILFNEVKRLGGFPIMSAAGHSLIKAKMIETKALLAGEMSAHIFFSDKYYGFDDAIYAGLRTIQTMNTQSQSIDNLYDSLPKMFNTPEIRIDCPEDKKFSLVQQIRQNLADEDFDISDIDGVRVTNEDGWWLLRASNTQAAITIRCESFNQKGLESLKKQVKNQLILNNVDISELF
ncbi:phosphomannomutase/phosphoglucomutase [Alphaproteobacteria bacterium]|nr:phosphomannomutase/phosphoglucomutase [Alphaproteobacteria bacterium]